MTKKQKRQLYKILLAIAISTAASFIPGSKWMKLILYVCAYLVVGGNVLKKALQNIWHGQVFDENFLMSIATIGAFILQDYLEGITVMIFYQVGELFQSYAVNQSRKSIASLMDIRPDSATVIREGKEIMVDPEEVSVEELIIVRPGEKVPLDGVVTEGKSTLDTAALTGESVPRGIKTGDEIISGCINLTGILKICVKKEFGESTVAKILDLVENASSQKAKVEGFITRFARYYTPIVVIAAVILALVPPLLIEGHPFPVWIYRALTFLVISCPCALVISVPLSFFGGIGAASRYGVLVKGSNYLELLSKTKYMVFDKTGTLTNGAFQVTEIKSKKPEELLKWAAYAEAYSNHPISQSIKTAYKEKIDMNRIGNVEEISGRGMKAVIDGQVVYAGNEKLMGENQIAYDRQISTGTVVYVAVGRSYLGSLLIADTIKEDSANAIQELKEAGIKKTVMLTGDSDAIGQKVAEELGIDEAYTQLLPGDKVKKIEEMLREKPQEERLAFVGDGINDAPVLARADVGIAMGGLGSDAAIEAADIVIMTDEPSKIAGTIRISQKTLKICRQNIIFALGIKLIVLTLGAFGLTNMWAAVFADVGVSVIAILNSMRTLYYHP